jgi:hypothetical protein
MPLRRIARSLSRPAIAALASAFLLSSGTAGATDVCYNGGPLLAGFQLNGDALLDGKDLILTRSVGDQRSSVMYIPLFSASKDFHIQLAVIITQISSGGADGIAFLMHNDPAGPGALGQPGGGIGYQDISHSVAVEFDTYHNPWDPDGNHIGITRDGDVDHTSAHNAIFPPPIDPPDVYLKSGKAVTLWIDYDHVATKLSAFVSATTTKPATPSISATIDLQATLGSTFTVGFTSSTGGSWSQHEVSQLIATDDHSTAMEACCQIDADCAGAAAGPLCDPVKHLCGQCTAQDSLGCSPAASACDISGASGACVAPCDGNHGAKTPHECPSSQFPTCWPTGTCASCNGDLKTAAAYPCPGGAPFCSPSGYCGRCSANADCLTPGILHSGSVCNTSLGACVSACQADADCGPGNVCDPKDHTCGLADSHGPCTVQNATICRSGVCGAASGVCLHGGGCLQDGDCAGLAPLCDLASSTCVACTVDHGLPGAHPCPSAASPVCAADGSCRACSGPLDCAGPAHAGPVCDSGRGSCGLACSVDADCPGQWCSNPSGDPGGGLCAAKIPNSMPLPAVDPIDGLCSKTAATRVCQSKVCSTVDQLCGLPNGEGPCDYASVCRSGACGDDGLCGLPDGDACSSASVCRSATCSAGHCGAPQGAGGAGGGNAQGGAGGDAQGGASGNAQGGNEPGGAGNAGSGAGGDAQGGAGGAGGAGQSGGASLAGGAGQPAAGAGPAGGATSAGGNAQSGAGGNAQSGAAGSGGGLAASGAAGQGAGGAAGQAGGKDGGASGSRAGQAGAAGTMAPDGTSGSSGGGTDPSAHPDTAGAAGASEDLSGLTLEGSGCATASPRGGGVGPLGALLALLGLSRRRARHGAR